MLKTLREFISDLHPLATVKLGDYKMKAYEVLGRHTYMDKNGCITLNLDTYNYRAKFNDDMDMWSVIVYG